MYAFCMAASTQRRRLSEMPEKSASKLLNMLVSPSRCNASFKFSCSDSIWNFGNWT